MRKIKKQIILIPAMAAMLLTASDAWAVVTYNITDLGTLGGIESNAYGIDSLGQTVRFSYDSCGQMRAFVYESGLMVDLGALGGSSGYALDINNSEQIAGYDSISGQTHSFVSTPIPDRPLGLGSPVLIGRK